ncbi:MAG: hypothetical protein K0S01_969 [Herbinix sp.]|jgi:hypothetical protein|nr:hypothetical protein [Herbinix sp.]
MKIRLFNSINIRPIDFVPAFSGLIGKTALVTSFAVVWATELNIINPNFVFENVRIEMIIGSIITLLAALLMKDTAPSGTLAPLIVMVPTMVNYGVHPFILSLLVGIVGIISIKTNLFQKLIALSGAISKTSLTLTIGIAGILLSIKSLVAFFGNKHTPLFLIMIALVAVYLLLLKWNKLWLIIPVAAVISLLISTAFDISIGNVTTISLPSFNPSYWWNEMWGIGFGFELQTILKTLPFAFFVLLLWAVDTVSITSMLDATYQEQDKREEINLNRSFTITSLRNMIGGLLGGAQTSALWRSFLIPLFIVKRPLRPASIILGFLGIIAGFTAIPIKVLSFPPLIWSVLLFGIFLPFVMVGLKNLGSLEKLTQKIIIIMFSLLGVLISPIVTWLGAVLYEKLIIKFDKKLET